MDAFAFIGVPEMVSICSKIKVAVCFLLCLATSAQATNSKPKLTPSESPIYVSTTGNVILTFLSKEAAYSNDLFLVGNPNKILNNQTAKPGTQYSLGSFQAGTELSFSMFVSNTGHTFFNGSANLNPDKFIHAAYALIGPSTIKVGFEDLYKGGDKDYNDLVFSLTNVTLTPIPEPEILGLLLGGLGLVGFKSRRRI